MPGGLLEHVQQHPAQRGRPRPRAAPCCRCRRGRAPRSTASERAHSASYSASSVASGIALDEELGVLDASATGPYPRPAPGSPSSTSRNHSSSHQRRCDTMPADRHQRRGGHDDAMRVLVGQPLALQPHDAALQVEPAEQLGALVGGAVGSGPRGAHGPTVAPEPVRCNGTGALWQAVAHERARPERYRHPGPHHRCRARRRDRPAPGRRPRRRVPGSSPRPLPSAHPPTAPSCSTAAPTTGSRGRPPSARHPVWRPCSTTRPCAPGSPVAATGTSACRAGLMPVVAQRLDLGSRGGEWDWMWTRDAPPVVDRRGARRGARPGRPGRGRGVPHRAQPAHPRAALRAAGQRWVAVREPRDGCAGRRGRQRAVRRGHPHPRRHRGRDRPAGRGMGRGRHRPPHPAARSPRPARARWGCSPTTTSPAGSTTGWATRPGWSGPDAGSGREVSLVWNRPPTAKGQRCPRSATAPSTSTSRTAAVTAARRPHPRLAAQRRLVVASTCRPSGRRATGSSPTTAAASAQSTSPATPRPTTTTRLTGDLDAVLHRARPARRDPRRLLDGRRRGGPLPRHPRRGPRAQRRLRRRHPAVPKLKDDDHPDGALDDETVARHAAASSRPTRPASSTAS